jgi:ABC-2 type transport system permease protein
VDIFGGVTKLLLYGVVPAGFVASVPARLVEDFDAGSAAGLAAVTVAFAAAALVTFRSGLRRYQSGATWTRA